MKTRDCTKIFLVYHLVFSYRDMYGPTSRALIGVICIGMGSEVDNQKL